MQARENTAQSDQELLFMSITDPNVFASIVDRYQGPFIKKAITILGNEEDAQDVVQEAFVKIYLNADKFERRTGATLSSWAYKILLNTCFSHYKKHKREKSNAHFDESIFAEAEEVEEESQLERFLSVLSKVPESASRLLHLLIVEGKSYEEVGKLEGVTDSALRVRVHRAKQAFKKTLIQNPNL